MLVDESDPPIDKRDLLAAEPRDIGRLKSAVSRHLVVVKVLREALDRPILLELIADSRQVLGARTIFVAHESLAADGLPERLERARFGEPRSLVELCGAEPFP